MEFFFWGGRGEDRLLNIKLHLVGGDRQPEVGQEEFELELVELCQGEATNSWMD